MTPISAQQLNEWWVQHDGFLRARGTSTGQAKDSETICRLIFEVKKLREERALIASVFGTTPEAVEDAAKHATSPGGKCQE